MKPSRPLPKGVTLLPSGRFRARFMHNRAWHTATFDTAKAAEAWLTRTRNELTLGIHPDTPPEPEAKPPAPALADYAEAWLAGRELKPRSRTHYRRILDRFILPSGLAGVPVDRISPAMVREWHNQLDPQRPVYRAHAYGLLRTILSTAYSDDLIAANPCRIRGAGSARRKSRTTLPTPAEVQQLADAMPSGKYRTMVLVAAWCGLRFGELTELRQGDVVRDAGGQPTLLKVRRAVSKVDGEFIVSTPKSEAGIRDVAVPPHIRATLGEYLATRPRRSDTLLFPGSRSRRHMAPASLYRTFHRAREQVGLPTLRWHDLRHFAGTTAAQSGATLAELQSRLGHSTVAAAMRYQHAAAQRDIELAERLSALADTGDVVPLRRGTA